MSEVLTERDGAVLTIVLNRPDVFNAFNLALHQGLRDALEQAVDPEVRAVVITGAGRGFCAGQDLKEFQEMPESIRERLEATYHPNIRAIRGLAKPVLAAVNAYIEAVRDFWLAEATLELALTGKSPGSISLGSATAPAAADGAGGH